MVSPKTAAARLTSMTATDAKNEFGRAMDTVLQGGAVVITKHDAPKAVLISFQEYNRLKGAWGRRLDRLTGEFDALLEGMQRPASRAAMKTAFGASPKHSGAPPSRPPASVADPSCIYVLAGTNGAGKSSLAGARFRASGVQYFNPDEAARHILRRQLHRPHLPR